VSWMSGELRLVFEQQLPVHREALFTFHEDPEHLIALLDGWRYSEIVKHDGHIREGARLHIRERFGPLRIKLVFEHWMYEAPFGFAEEQVEGPFRVFRHKHEFEQTNDGTIVRDHVTIALKWWLGGLPVTRWFVRPRLIAFFAWRQAALRRLLNEGAIPDPPP